MIASKTKDLGHFNLYLGPELGRLIRMLAAEQGMTLAAFLCMIVRKYVSELDQQPKPKGETV